MDKKFLNKVVDQIVSETRIDYGMGEIQFPFQTCRPPFFSFPPPLSHTSPLSLTSLFTKHCIDVYGLNDDEVNYVWKEYKRIIIDIIKNNGL